MLAPPGNNRLGSAAGVYGYWSIDLDVLITTAVKHLPAMAARLVGFTIRDRLGERSW